MKIKTSELDGTQLDWAVAKCEGYVDNCNSWLYEATLSEVEDGHYKPSMKWEQAGPIIEREKISVSHSIEGDWVGYYTIDFDMQSVSRGPTPLVAAMRCYVASKLGDTVDIPEELI